MAKFFQKDQHNGGYTGCENKEVRHQIAIKSGSLY